MRYQFQVDNRPAGPLRSDWAHAAQDAVAAGYGCWTAMECIKLDDQATVARIPEAQDVR